MNAIVFVFMPGRDSQQLAEQAAALPVVDVSPVSARPILPNTSKLDQTTPPLWTWFIENPRGGERAAI